MNILAVSLHAITSLDRVRMQIYFRVGYRLLKAKWEHAKN